MLELGQPTHAFDADKLNGNIQVRMGREGEQFLALDGRTYRITPADLMIADQQRAVGIGGVMGGEETGVIDSTRNILLEAAYFSPAAIRRTARTLNLPSDASYRFERGVDPGMVLRASQRAAELMRNLAGGHPSAEIMIGGQLPSDPPDVGLRYRRCDQLLGISIPPARVDEILEKFGLTKVPTGNGSAQESSWWKIPSHRRDLRREVDLIEEVVRLHGVQKIGGSDRSRFTPDSAADTAHDREAGLREILAAHGLSEARTSKLVPRSTPAFDDAIELRNPLSEDHVALRSSLLGGLLDVLGRNIRGGAERVAIFEIGRVFLPTDAREEKHLGVLLWGRKSERIHWRADQKERLDFFDLKGALSSVLPGELQFDRIEHDHLALAVAISMNNQIVGIGGQLSSALAAKFDASGAVLIAELSADAALEIGPASKRYEEFGRFPSVTRDIAMIVPRTVTHENIYAAILRVPEPLLERVELFDVFSGKDAEQLGPERKSLAYTLTYRDKSRTLTSDEVTAAHSRIRQRLQSELGAELREQ